MRLRVWYVKNPPANAEYFEVDSVEKAIKRINVLTSGDLCDSSVVANAMGLEVYEDFGNIGWSEYYDDEGRDIDEIIASKEEENEQQNKR